MLHPYLAEKLTQARQADLAMMIHPYLGGNKKLMQTRDADLMRSARTAALRAGGQSRAVPAWRRRAGNTLIKLGRRIAASQPAGASPQSRPTSCTGACRQAAPPPACR